jgi:hypothetical protein
LKCQQFIEKLDIDTRAVCETTVLPKWEQIPGSQTPGKISIWLQLVTALYYVNIYDAMTIDEWEGRGKDNPTNRPFHHPPYTILSPSEPLTIHPPQLSQLL